MKYNTETFIEKVKEIHGDKYDYSKIIYSKSLDYVIVICPIHGEFKIKAYHLLRGHGCKKCANLNYSEKRKLKASNLFIEKAIKVHGNKFDYSNVKYSGNRSKICIICSKHGKFWQTPHEHLSGCGCPKCGFESIQKKLSFTQEQFIEKAKEIHGDKYDYSKVKYINFTTPVEIICLKHGSFWQKPVLHLILNCGCPKCILKGLTILFEKLSQDIPEAEFKFEVTCKSVPWLKRMRLDIYSSKLNIAIEYDGIQHFKNTNFRGHLTNIKSILENDLKKLELCKINGCELFRLKFNYTQNEYNSLIQNIKYKLSSI